MTILENFLEALAIGVAVYTGHKLMEMVSKNHHAQAQLVKRFDSPDKPVDEIDLQSWIIDLLSYPANEHHLKSGMLGNSNVLMYSDALRHQENRRMLDESAGSTSNISDNDKVQSVIMRYLQKPLNTKEAQESRLKMIKAVGNSELSIIFACDYLLKVDVEKRDELLDDMIIKNGNNQPTRIDYLTWMVKHPSLFDDPLPMQLINRILQTGRMSTTESEYFSDRILCNPSIKSSQKVQIILDIIENQSFNFPLSKIHRNHYLSAADKKTILQSIIDKEIKMGSDLRIHMPDGMSRLLLDRALPLAMRRDYLLRHIQDADLMSGIMDGFGDKDMITHDRRQADGLLKSTLNQIGLETQGQLDLVDSNIDTKSNREASDTRVLIEKLVTIEKNRGALNAQVELKEIYDQAMSIRKGSTDRIAAIKENPFLFALLTKDDHLRKDSQLLKELIKKDPQMIVMLSLVQQQDPQFGLLALQQDPSTIQYLSPTVRDNLLSAQVVNSYREQTKPDANASLRLTQPDISAAIYPYSSVTERLDPAMIQTCLQKIYQQRTESDKAGLPYVSIFPSESTDGIDSDSVDMQILAIAVGSAVQQSPIEDLPEGFLLQADNEKNRPDQSTLGKALIAFYAGVHWQKTAQSPTTYFLGPRSIDAHQAPLPIAHDQSENDFSKSFSDLNIETLATDIKKNQQSELIVPQRNHLRITTDLSNEINSYLDPESIRSMNQAFAPNNKKTAPQDENNSGIPSPDSDPRRRSQ